MPRISAMRAAAAASSPVKMWRIRPSPATPVRNSPSRTWRATRPLIQRVVEGEVAGASAGGAVEHGRVAHDLHIGLDGDKRPAARAPNERFAVVDHPE